jgi:IS5 family transposase
MRLWTLGRTGQVVVMPKRTPLPKQLSFSAYELLRTRRVTRRERFFSEMERVVPWERLEAVIEPLYPSTGRVGHPPIGLPVMLRMCCLQQRFGLFDEGLEDAIYDSQAMRGFIGIDLARQSVPDTTTPLRFRRLLEEHHLTAAIFAEINAHFAERGLLLRECRPRNSPDARSFRPRSPAR